jgi:hypothetical protein
MDHSPMYGEALQCIQDGLEHEATAMSDNDTAVQKATVPIH